MYFIKTFIQMIIYCNSFWRFLFPWQLELVSREMKYLEKCVLYSECIIILTIM